MTAPSPPRSAPRPLEASSSGQGQAAGEAMAWLRSDRSAMPSFFPAAQAAVVLERWAAGGAPQEALEERSVAGDSAVARALATVHAIALQASARAQASAAGETTPAAPRALRDRILASTSTSIGAGRAGTSATGTSTTGTERAGASKPVVAPPPVIAVGLRHPHRLEEPARSAAIVALGADVRGGDPRLEQVLDRIDALLDFPLLVVSVVHGGETIHRAFRSALTAAPRVVPREASFCTHCVADDTPLVIDDAAADPFFRDHPAVAGFGLVAYCGVPLRLAPAAGASRGVVVGTLCGYDVRPRRHTVEDVAVLEVLARRVVAHITGDEDPSVLDREASEQVGSDVYAAPLFADLLTIELSRVAAGRASTLLIGAAPQPLPAGGERLVAGRLADGRAAWLLSSSRPGTPADAAAAAPLAALLAASSGTSVQVAALTPGDPADTIEHWIARASG